MSNHVSAGIVKQIRVPQPCVDTNIVELVDKQLHGEDVEEAIELAIAQLYGLPADEYKTVIDSFGFDDIKKTRIIRRYREICQDGEKEL